jgi:hypothetical protein
MTALLLAATQSPIHYLPIGTTVLSAAFAASLAFKAAKRGWPAPITWWIIGIFFYGLGTAIESTITLHGNTVLLNKLWYWAGAILGGYPLGTGSLYLLGKKKMANILTAISLTVVVIASIAIFLSPVNAEAIAADATRPSGAFLGWQWIRWITPFINLYAAVWLVGGAAWSSVQWATEQGNRGRAIGTALIAVGGLLPGVGGSMAKAGIVEALYVGEFLGIILIWLGSWMCARAPGWKKHAPSEPGPEAQEAQPKASA